ncbi:polyketide synthase, partial [Mycobacterium helveticum]
MGQPRVTPVAVVGMACRLPGGIDSPELLWAALLDGDDAPAEPPRQRWDADVFDCDFFGIGEREAVAIDPQQRLLLEVSWEAVDRAGLPAEALAGSSTGVFVGLTHGPHGLPGNGFGTASGWIAHAVGSHGPAMTVDTDCSSGLTAVHLACRSLHEGESDLALAADGFAPGEGAAALVLKRLPDALAGGDRILGVILGTAATHAPPARAAACLRALAAAGVDASTVGMVQAYGAAAAIGGPAGHAGVAEVYGVDAPCALGWVGT